MTKTAVTISIDSELKLILRARNINVSQVCENALYIATGHDPGKKLEATIDELKRMQTLQDEIIKNKKSTEDRWLAEFKLTRAESILNNPGALIYWSKKTGKTADELDQIKRGVQNDK